MAFQENHQLSRNAPLRSHCIFDRSQSSQHANGRHSDEVPFSALRYHLHGGKEM